MKFVDIHNHILFGLDDGSKDLETSKQMIDTAYAQGVRYLCFTPHFHPAFYRYTPEKFAFALEKVTEYTNSVYPDLKLYVGNELHYDDGARAWISSGECRTLGEGGRILVDFRYEEKAEHIADALRTIESAGFRPILAHAELYRDLQKKPKILYSIKDSGIPIQSDVQSLLGDFGFATKIWCKKLLKTGVIDCFASDAHNLSSRPMKLKEAAETVRKLAGDDAVDILFHDNPMHFLGID